MEMDTSRLARVRSEMEKEGLSQLIVSAPPSLYYLCGITTHPMERLLALYIGKEGTPVLFANELFALPDIAGVETVLHKDGDDAVQAIADTVQPGEIGIDKDWPARFLITLMEKHPGAKPVQGSGPVDRCRMRKDEKEAALMRHASKMNDEVMAESIAFIKEGITEQQLGQAIAESFRKRGGGGSGFAGIAFGANCADPHHSADGTVIKPGDSVVMDNGAGFDRYMCDMTRTVFFKEISEEAKRCYELVLAANEAAEALAKPGVPLKEMDAAARKIIEDGGYGRYFTHRLGHGIGLETHEPPDNSGKSDAVAEPGMVFSVEPGIYVPGKFGIRIEDLVLITETGCEILNKEPKGLLVV